MLRASDRFPFVLVEVGDRMNQHQLRKIAFLTWRNPRVRASRSNCLAADPQCQAGRSSLGATIASQDPFSSTDSSNPAVAKSL